VLIDFDTSIFRPSDYQTDRPPSRLNHGTGVGRFLDRLTYGNNKATAQKIEVFLAAMPDNPRILVVGGGTIGSGAEALYDGRAEVVATDIYPSPNIQLICDGHSLPFQAETFDGVLIQAVLEHVLDPARVVQEIHRVLRPGAAVYAETPFMQQVHEGAYDFTRFTLSGHRWLFRHFDEVEAGSILGPGVALLWSISHFIRALGLGGRVAALVTAMFFWVRLLDKRAKRGPANDAASGFFFIGRKNGVSFPAHQMPAYYEAYR
jgi:SAM-dependent methyltransferase